MLEDKDVEVRLAAVASLSEIRKKAVTNSTSETLEDEVPEVSFAAAKALWVLHDPSGKRALMAVLEGENKIVIELSIQTKAGCASHDAYAETAMLFAARQGAGFAPIPGLGGGIASMQCHFHGPGRIGSCGRGTAALPTERCGNSRRH